MHVGADVPAGLAEAQTQDKVKTNIFGIGFSAGERVTIGCSRKGRIWSRQTSPDLLSWIEWCRQIGAKIQNNAYSEEDILKNSIVPVDIDARPALMPLGIEWPDTFYSRTEDATKVYFGDQRHDFYEVGLELLNRDLVNPIKFRVFTPTASATYAIQFSKTGAEYVPVDKANVSIGVGKRKRTLPEWFQLESPIVRFEQDAFTKDHQLCRPHLVRVAPFDVARIQGWSWAGII
jgi:hypothetical protein